MSWASDVVSLTGTVLSGFMISVLELEKRSSDATLVACSAGVAVVAAILLAHLLANARHLMNGYPESLIQPPSRPLRRLMRLAPFLLPGLMLSVLGGLLLALAGATASR